jgi:hypothetical protein
LLKGKTVEQVLQIIPMLFSICGTAQSAAALKACERALKIEPDIALWQARLLLVELETQREHVLRVLLEGYQFKGETVPQEYLKYTVDILNQAKSTGFVNAKAFDLSTSLIGISTPPNTVQQEWSTFLATVIFGEDLMRWQERSTLELLQQWIDQQSTIAARILKSLQEQSLTRLGSSTFTLTGEASVLSRQAHQPLMQAALAEHGNGVFTRYLARLVELAFGVPSTLHIEAARGRLIHQVQLDDAGKVLDYQIIAPTEINFSADGVVSAGLKALMQSTRSDETLKYYADLWIKAVDPCVSYRCEIKHA